MQTCNRRIELGLFNNKQTEEATAKIASLEKQISELKQEVAILKEVKRSIEQDKKAIEMELKLYKEDEGRYNKGFSLNFEINESEKKLEEITLKIEEKKKEYIELDEYVLLQSFGLYAPKYNYANSNLYKERLNKIRAAQEDMIKNNTAAACMRVWSLAGSTTKGKKFTEDNIKQIIRTFNIECDDVVRKVKFNNYETSRKRIAKSFESLNKLNSLSQIVIQDSFLQLKYEELDLAFEFAQKLQEEKEELRQQREIRKEEIRVAKELEEKRADIEKEQQHYNNAMQRIQDQIDNEKNDERLVVLNEKKQQLINCLVDLDTALKDIDYREANQRAGYVYVISNIGAFGENVYKIGMTRRLDPQDRVDELGGASVPFRFDVHALIFSDDAPKLENALHHAFEARRVNMINNRKEFFNVTLEEIEKVAKENHDKTVEFKYLPDAQQYRESLLKKNSKIN